MALLTQVVAKGVRSFATGKANNPKEKDKTKKFNQGEAWTNDVDGIIPMLKAGYGGKGHCFYGVKWPGYQSVINHVTGKPSGLLILFAHLYTPGMEQARLRPAACLRSALPLPLAHACCLAVQAEPAEGGTEGTKDERPLTERDNLIIEVAELWKEAKQLEADGTDKKSADQAKAEKAGKFMQDAAVSMKYDGLNAAEVSVRAAIMLCRSHGRHHAL